MGQEKRETEKLFNDSNALILLVVLMGILTMVLVILTLRIFIFL